MLFDVSLPLLNLMARCAMACCRVFLWFSHLHYTLSNGRQLEDISPFIAPGLFLGHMKQFSTFGSIFGRPNFARFDIEKGVWLFLKFTSDFSLMATSRANFHMERFTNTRAFYKARNLKINKNISEILVLLWRHKSFLIVLKLFMNNLKH